MIILDTNVLSALMVEPVDARVVAWLDRQPRVSIWTTSISVLEIRFGLATMADGRRRQSRVSAFEHLIDDKARATRCRLRPKRCGSDGSSHGRTSRGRQIRRSSRQYDCRHRVGTARNLRDAQREAFFGY